jgi:ABC-2 type transport system permease protein
MPDITKSVVLLLLINAAFLLLCTVVLALLLSKRPAGKAVLKRNFMGYFSNPTGYLFILLFVSMCSLCAFYPHDFFNNNLATLHQLNTWFPWIMLIYIPTITMGVWSEERRQGTDELLLTVPASDWDIVGGKYLAAAAIFTVSLLFSQISNFMVLAFLSMGEVDLGLFQTTYLGYWFIGISMIALGMVGSFLTRNVTIGFILGVLLNLPLVLASLADAFFSGNAARLVARFSHAEQFFDFGNGVVSVRSLVFFGLVIAFGLYLSVVLVGRRHWSGGRDGQSLLGHYVARVLSLSAIAVALTAIFANADVWRIDSTTEDVNSLSASTLDQIDQLRQKLSDEDARPVLVEAFISANIPETYAKTKVDLIAKLREFEAKGGNRIQVRIYDDLEPFSDEAVRAEEQYGIEPATVMVRERGAIRQEDIFMGAAFTFGLEKVVVPFFDQGIPVEYELIRSICTVTDPSRKRLGIVTTDAQMFGGFDMQRMSQTPKQLIVEELEKQYEVVQIDPNEPITEEVDVLMAVQPSSLTQPQLDHLVAEIRKGTPTAIFEDPMPVMMNAPGTSQPKPPRGGMMGMGGPPEPKGDIQQLWNLLGIKMVGTEQMGRFSADVVWQDYNPYKKAQGFRQITKEWVFASPEAPGAEKALNPNDQVVAGLQQILLLFPGAISQQSSADREISPIIQTGDMAGTIGYQDLTMGADSFSLELKRRRSAEPLVLAVRIRSKSVKPDAGTTSGTTGSETTTQFVAGQAEMPPNGLTTEPSGAAVASAEPKIDVVYVGDIDLMHSEFLRVRAQPNMGDIEWNFDNVTFVLNVVDDLAQDERFLEVRKKQTRHSTLKLVEEAAAAAREEADEQINRFNEEFQVLEEEAKQKQTKSLADLQEKITDLTQKAQGTGQQATGREIQRALQAAVQQMAMKEQVEQRRLDTTVERLTRQRDRELQRIERDLDTQVRRVQNVYKGLALFLPMIPPVLIGAAVFIRRRSLESEGTSTARRR